MVNGVMSPVPSIKRKRTIGYESEPASRPLYRQDIAMQNHNDYGEGHDKNALGAWIHVHGNGICETQVLYRIQYQDIEGRFS